EKGLTAMDVDRKHVDDRACRLALQQVLHHALHEKEGSAHIGGENIVEQCLVRFCKGAACGCRRCIDQCVDAPQPFDGCGDDSPAVGNARQIGGNEDRVCALRL